MYTIAYILYFLVGCFILAGIFYVCLTVSYNRYQTRRDIERIKRKANKRLTETFSNFSY